MPRKKKPEIRDRIKELRRVRAGDLLPNPANWRKHPKHQRDVLQAVLTEVGYADALLARETPAGLMLIDGHLRAETTPDQLVPVLVLDVDAAEAGKLLAVLDPLAGLAEIDTDQFEALRETVETNDASLRQLLDSVTRDSPPLPALLEQAESAAAYRTGINEAFQILVKCDDEAAQVELLERLTAEGFECRALIA